MVPRTGSTCAVLVTAYTVVRSFHFLYWYSYWYYLAVPSSGMSTVLPYMQWDGLCPICDGLMECFSSNKNPLFDKTNDGEHMMTNFKSIIILVKLLLLPCTVAFAGWGPIIPSLRHATATTTKTQVHSVSDIDRDVVQQQPDSQLKTIDILSLASIRSTLIRQEETIIFALIERAQFRQNLIVYEKGGFGDLGTPPGSTPVDGEILSFLEYMLVGTETLHCGSRRYQSPEEHAFFPDYLPAGPLENLPRLQYPEGLLSSEGGASDVNFNKRLLQKYIDEVVPKVCKAGDDEQHGSTTLCDIAVLQALSRRVHYGKFVAESKYRSDPENYQRLVELNDAEGVMTLLTDSVVEEKVLRRARLKAATYGSEPLLTELPPIEGTDSTSTLVAAAAASAVVAALSALDKCSNRNGKVDPSVIEDFYRDIIIPMTKDIEVAYLFRRCGKEPPPQYRE